MHVTFDLYRLEKEACTCVNRLKEASDRLNKLLPYTEKRPFYGSLGESTSPVQ